VRTAEAEAPTPKLCACGCGQEVTSKTVGVRFIRGHNMRVPRAKCACGCGGTPTRAAYRFVAGHQYVGIRPWPNCRRCGRKAKRPGKALDSYDPDTNTYLCPWCHREAVQCRRCGRVVQRTPALINNLKSLERKDGRLTYLCRDCQSHDRLRSVARPMLAWFYEKGREETSEALATHVRSLVKRAGGRGALNQARDAARSQGLTEKGRRQLSVHKLVTAASKRQGEFRLCALPSCRRLIYFPPSRLKQGAAFHRTCYLLYMESPEYLDWRQKIGDLRSPLFRARLARHPHPSPPAPEGRPATQEQWLARFRWTLKRFLLRKSWREIATEEHYRHSTVEEGVQAFISHLPDSWTEMFCGSRPGHRLDELMPVGRLRP